MSTAKNLIMKDLLHGIATCPELTPASGLKPPPGLWLPTGIAALDVLVSGWPRGRLSEVFGSASSGRTSLYLAALATATRHGESCALVDASDAFDPHTAQQAGVNLDRLLWVRCGLPQRGADSHFGKTAPSARQPRTLVSSPAATAVEQALRATDLLLQSGGFGLVVMDLCDVPAELARKVPLTSWFRLSRAVEHTPTVLLLVTPESCARTCASLVLRLHAPEAAPEAATSLPSHARLLRGLRLQAEVIRSRAEAAPGRKPNQPHAAWSTRAAWTG